MPKTEGRLVVVSNRVPPVPEVASSESGLAFTVSGLVSALKPALEDQGGLWFGWSGKTADRKANAEPTVSTLGRVQMATLDLSADEVSLYYTGFSNRALWPILHSFPSRAVIRQDAYRAYRRVNRRFAEALYPLLKGEDLVWVQDYHLLHLGQELRELGWKGRLGFFLHVPFPPADIFAILPWAKPILESLMQYDLVGVHTDRYLHNLADGLEMELGGKMTDNEFSHIGSRVRLGVYPIGIVPSAFTEAASRPGRSRQSQVLRRTPPDHRMILGVERLDYTKGIPQRLMAFERMLEQHPSFRGKVSYVQISVPSRTRVPEYIEEKNHVDRLVGQINGRFSEDGWSPIVYLYRSFNQQALAQLYRQTDVCLVTPLRDGMNLVAKEFVASQGPDPGALVLSKFSGAADSMRDAIIVNPFDIDGTAHAMFRAMTMSAQERRRHWSALMAVVERDTAKAWRESFQVDLALA